MTPDLADMHHLGETPLADRLVTDVVHVMTGSGTDVCSTVASLMQEVARKAKQLGTSFAFGTGTRQTLNPEKQCSLLQFYEDAYPQRVSMHKW